MSWKHIPILAREITDLLITNPDGVYIDGTLGLGGHTKFFMSKLSAQGKVIGLDKDPNAVKMAVENVADARLLAFNLSYLNAKDALLQAGVDGAHGILFDLGLSSYQLDDPKRGFSFLQEGPLDMRFDNTGGQTAADIINTLPADELEELLLKYADERNARKIALAVYDARVENGPLLTTTALAKVIEKVCRREGKIHPATKTFQALRIAVNGELEAVESSVKILPQIIKQGGRAAFLTFHSTEDRIIKYALKDLCSDGSWQLVNKKVIEPQWEEVKNNPRARSAKLRVAQRLK
jgi:16S rRNA (cytosine1402-N4)-methyltransferase